MNEDNYLLDITSLTEEIKKCIKNIAYNYYKISKYLYTIKENKLYEKDYSSFEEYINNNFPFNRITAYKLIETYKYFIIPFVKKNPINSKDEFEIVTFSNYSYTKLVPFLPLVKSGNLSDEKKAEILNLSFNKNKSFMEQHAKELKLLMKKEENDEINTSNLPDNTDRIEIFKILMNNVINMMESHLYFLLNIQWSNNIDNMDLTNISSLFSENFNILLQSKRRQKLSDKIYNKYNDKINEAKTLSKKNYNESALYISRLEKKRNNELQSLNILEYIFSIEVIIKRYNLNYNSLKKEIPNFIRQYFQRHYLVKSITPLSIDGTLQNYFKEIPLLFLTCLYQFLCKKTKIPKIIKYNPTLYTTDLYFKHRTDVYTFFQSYIPSETLGNEANSLNNQPIRPNDESATSVPTSSKKTILERKNKLINNNKKPKQKSEGELLKIKYQHKNT
ncbi:MAG TPA: hypothetical protein DDY71_16555 [Spirochaetia bacterium]|nr:MAG: hypothetical protein A2Y29_01535 [Spirochaetes bacterium GWE2_31_10]HBD94629.1 hypothetical protein [Spirochaetia bacterium]HBI39255.1 hypothetical protein [Spirochaetia bacterium]